MQRHASRQGERKNSPVERVHPKIGSRLRSWLLAPALSAQGFALLVSVFIALSGNTRLYGQLAERLDISSPQGLAYVLMLYVALVTILVALLLLFGVSRALKPLALGMLILSALLGYFAQEWGVIFDEEMIVNIVETYRDRNSQEALELVSLPLLFHVLLYGVFPGILFARIRIPAVAPLRAIASRMKLVGTMLVLVALLFGSNYKFSVFFWRENRDLRCLVIPTYAMHSLEVYLSSRSGDSNQEFRVLGEDAKRSPKASRTIGVFVLGETARADHFSLNGYDRLTNPRLQARELLNFPDVASSGTSTAVSVPAMFSFLNREDFSLRKAAGQSNVLDVLDAAGVEVIWIDNNSSSKGVCDRIGSLQLKDMEEGIEHLATGGELLDEVLLDAMDRKIESSTGDVLIVLHTLGSHGPAYHRRYPESFEHFTPSCKADAPQSCNDQELINAYDNTILYTDYILDQVIERIEGLKDGSDRFMLYASDHGESLGEKGIYLHGMPYFLAPAAQTQVPMLGWLSPSFILERGINYQELVDRTAAKYSHDNISHTLLGLYGIETSLYAPELDLFRSRPQASVTQR